MIFGKSVATFCSIQLPIRANRSNPVAHLIQGSVEEYPNNDARE